MGAIVGRFCVVVDGFLRVAAGWRWVFGLFCVAGCFGFFFFFLVWLLRCFVAVCG